MRLPAMARQLRESPLGRQAGWVAAPFAIQQFTRLATNIALARLLAPEMLGLMLLVNTLRTGAELLSDIGIGQSVVRSERGEERPFLNTAWTLQVLRGCLLLAAVAAAAVPVSRIYSEAELGPIILAVSPVFLITGLQSPSLFLMQRRVQLKSRAYYDVGCAVFQAVVTVGLAAVMPTVWALVWGLVISNVFSTAASYFVGERLRPRFAWHREHFSEIFNFGKWIFLSTAVYFAATSTDRIYFVAVLPLALAGVYSVARTFADMLGQLAQRAGSFVVFPRLAAMGEARGEAARRLRSKRFAVLAAVAAVMAVAIAGSDRFILLFYDSRYEAAAFMLPVLLAGAWFGVLGAFADAMLMGCGRPAAGAWANGVKFAVLLVLLPVAVARGGLFEALLVLAVAEVARWAWLTPALQQEKLAKVTDDLALTILLAVLAVAAKIAFGWIGLAPSIEEWWALGAPFRG